MNRLIDEPSNKQHLIRIVARSVFVRITLVALSIGMTPWMEACALPLTLRPASREVMPGSVDSNSPAHWDGDTFYLLNSVGHPSRSQGADLFHLAGPQPVSFNNAVNGGRWMEATWKAGDGVLYGWYHFEPNGICANGLTAPRIGAARSRDDGLSWEDLGIILMSPPRTNDCQSLNHYFAGGHGDFSVMLDENQQWLYFWFGSYGGDVSEQGVAVARMAWSDRDNPVDRVWKWHADSWQEPGRGGRLTPLFPAMMAWNLADADAFWGPSVHWNTHLNRYVMLLNRAGNSAWQQEGIYVSFAMDLSEVTQWTEPQKILDGGGWYPQVIGIGEQETDKLASRVARLFVHGVSDFEIVFEVPEPATIVLLSVTILAGVATAKMRSHSLSRKQSALCQCPGSEN